ncbi:hypothetical protein [Endozoicomonas sp. GU-1]|uniref:hypothetical protein n=1 Tax=Endozoicomonas sp. GU-1 TaxID=3009078 RepID=UPI0022B544D9|nr:hypothetical protein [Endozoicomonas sp. GU-1]WBA82908.1 hypothetical protein O2T12_07240 [Endozoicomonas sp. GU-1]
MSKVDESTPSQPAIPPNSNSPKKPQNTSTGRISQIADAEIKPTIGKAGHALSNKWTDFGLEKHQITLSSKITDLKQSKQEKDQLIILEEKIQTATQKLTDTNHNSPEQCQQIKALINAYMDELEMLDDPPCTTRQLALFRDYLQEQLVLMPNVYKGILLSSPNTNKRFLSEMATKINDKIIATMQAPDHIFEDLAIPAEIEREVRIPSDSCHESDMLAMKADLDKQGQLVIPNQIGVDLIRNTVRIHNNNGVNFDNSALCAQYRHKMAHNETDAANEVRQALEGEIISNLDGLPIETKMQILSHINQTELNHMLYCLQGTLFDMMPDWGLLTQQNPELAIDVIRNNNSTDITYRMNAIPTLAGGGRNY